MMSSEVFPTYLKVHQTGTSLMVVIPKEYAEHYGISKGDVVRIRGREDTIEIEKKRNESLET